MSIKCLNCHVPTVQHECDSKAEVICLIDGSEYPDTPENRTQYEEDIRGESVACSICGRSAISMVWWM
jgi:hypothetical protein